MTEIPLDAVAPPRAAVLAKRRRRVPISAAVAATFIGFTLLVIVAVPFLSLYDPLKTDLSNSLQAPFQTWDHPLGTDNLGRDQLSRLALAGRTTVLIIIPALLLNITVGVVLGLVSGFFGRFWNTAIMAFADLQLSIPLIVLLIMVVAVVGPSTTTLVITLGLCYWVGYARVARVIALTVREREFVQAATTFGGSNTWIIRKHLLPHLLAPIIILGSFDLGVLIILESSLSYLGLGIQPPQPSWGQMVFAGQSFAEQNVWLVLLPTIAIFLPVAGLQILSQRFTGEGGDARTTARSM